MQPINYRKTIAYLSVLFVLLFVLRLGYGYLRWPDGAQTVENSQSNTSYDNDGFSDSRRNYASTKYEKGGKDFTPSTPTAEPTAYDQKYEKIGTIDSRSSAFDEDVKKVKSTIKQNNGLIQYERQSGLKGGRYMHLAVGIPPDNFDASIEAFKTIGNLTNIRIDKTDKTNEFQKLKASRATLEAHLASLMTLKSQNGKIEELMNLEEKIQDINSQLQSLGVSLGEFDSQNEFCTVKFTLTEVKVIENIIPFYNRLYHAFTWTVKYFALILFGLLMGLGALLAAFKVKDALKDVLPHKD